MNGKYEITYNSFGTPFVQADQLPPAPRYYAPRISGPYREYVSPFGPVYFSCERYFVRCGSKGIFSIVATASGTFNVFCRPFPTLDRAVAFGLTCSYASQLGFQVSGICR